MSAVSNNSVFEIPVIALEAIQEISNSYQQAIQALEEEVQNTKLLMPYEGVLELNNIPSNQFLDNIQLESSIELVAAQSAALYQNNPKQGLEAQKIGLIKAAKCLPSSIVNQANVFSSMEALAASTTPLELKERKQEVIHALRNNNISTQKDTLSNIILDASLEIGFPMRIEKSDNDTIVRMIGKNKQANQAIVSEILVDKKGRLQLKTETLNTNDTQCANTLKSFNKALTKRGVKCKTNIRMKQEALIRQRQAQRQQSNVHVFIQKRRK